MSSTAAATSDKIVLNFGWRGPNIWNGGSSRSGLDVRVVDLVFKDARTDISVHLPENIGPVAAQKFPFTCRRYHETEMELGGRKVKTLLKETHPDSLCVTVEQVRHLTVRAGFFEKGRPIGPRIMDSSTGRITQQETVRRTDRDIRLEIPEELEIGQTYSLVVASDALSLSARLLKAGSAEGKMDGKRRISKDEFQGRMKKMGEALIKEGIQNLDLASKGGVGVFDSSSTTADVFAHGMKGIIRSGQQMHPEISVPHTKTSDSLSDLNMLTTGELQLRFGAAFKKDKEFASQRMRAALAGNIKEMNRIIEVELAHIQLLINLAEALERKGVKAQIPI